MPKQSEFPRLRVSVKRGKKGQVWSSWWYDMRGTGQPDIALGTDHAAALVKWAEITAGGPRTKGTLEEAFAGWEQRGIECKPNGQPRKPETIAGYLKCLRAIRKPFGAARWEDITLPVLAQYIRKRSAKGRAKQEMQLLSVIWAWARLEGMTAPLQHGRDGGKVASYGDASRSRLHPAVHKVAEHQRRQGRQPHLAQWVGLQHRQRGGLGLARLARFQFAVTVDQVGHR